MRTKMWLGAIGICVLLGLALAVTASENRSAEGSLPSDVLAALKASYPDATIEEVVVEERNGSKFYEVELEENETEWEVLLAEDGKVIQTEVEIDAKDLPEAVRAQIRSTYPNGKVVDIARIVRGQMTLFEVDLTEDGHTQELLYTADGTLRKTTVAGDDDQSAKDDDEAEATGDEDDDQNVEEDEDD